MLSPVLSNCYFLFLLVFIIVWASCLAAPSQTAVCYTVYTYVLFELLGR